MLDCTRSVAILVSLVVMLSPMRSSGETIENIATSDGFLDTSQFAGRVVYVDFWASWCVPCRSAFDWMNNMHDLYGDRGLVIIAVNLDRASEDAEAFLKKAMPRFAIAYDAKATMAKAYDLAGMPSSFIYDSEGTLVSSHVGFRKRDQAALEKEIQRLLPVHEIESSR